MNHNINRFYIQLNKYQNLVVKNTKSNLIKEWNIHSKIKKKNFYKLYWVLRKTSINIKYKKTFKQNWIISSFIQKKNCNKSYIYKKKVNLKTFKLLNTPFFYNQNKIKNFVGIQLKGYTSYGDKVLNYKKANNIM